MMILAADRSRTTLTVALVALLTGILTLIMTDSGHGLQEESQARTVTRVPVDAPEFGVRGDFSVRLQLAGQDEIYLEKVLEVSLREDWAILRILEEEEGKIATLMVPREAVGFVKIWEDIPEAK